MSHSLVLTRIARHLRLPVEALGFGFSRAPVISIRRDEVILYLHETLGYRYVKIAKLLKGTPQAVLYAARRARARGPGPDRIDLITCPRAGKKQAA